MAAEGGAPATGEMTLVVGLDESDHSYHALQWALQHFFPPGRPHQCRLVVVTAKPTAVSAVGFAGPGAADVLPIVESDLKRSALRVIDRARELCAQAQAGEVAYEVVEGDARNVLCDAVERHRAEMLAVGSHGYGAIKRSLTLFSPCCFLFSHSSHLCTVDLPEPHSRRAVLGSVSDYCAHHAHCTVMIVKKPKQHKH
jgi:nucleotide-binding universal stress UspA family protein